MKYVEMQNLSKSYRITKQETFMSYIFHNKRVRHEIQGLNEVTMDIRKGESVALIGKNGAGKSTLIKLVAGILKPDNGSIKVFSHDPMKHRRENNFRIGAVFGQRCQLRWDVSAHESCLLFKHIYRISNNLFEERYKHLRNVLGLDSFIHQPVRTLSLGQKMRAELCAALLHDPELLLLDEPTIGLDVFSKSAMLELLKRIHQKQRSTLLLTTHNSQDIEALCERTVILEKGRIVFDGPTSGIRENVDTISKIVFTCMNRAIVPPSPCDHLFYEISDHRLSVLNVKQTDLPAILSTTLQLNNVKEIRIQNHDFDTILRKFYGESDA